MAAPITPPPAGTVFTKDPVAITTALFTFLLGITSVLLITGVFSDVAGGVISGVITAAWAACQLLFVRPATVPRQPLEELAAAEAAATPMPQVAQPLKPQPPI
jgi:hypothetical protein